MQLRIAKKMIRSAKEIYVDVHGTSDTYLVKITKAEALILMTKAHKQFTADYDFTSGGSKIFISADR
jgi:hypothetical protein